MTTSRQANSPPPVTLALPEHPRSMAIVDGTVKAAGIQLTCVHQFKSGSERHNNMAQGKYDASEMGLVAFMLIWLKGGNQLALPAFWLRGFRESAIFCRQDSPMKSFSELKGKTIGVTLFYSSGIVVSRGMLEDYGVPVDSVTWVAAEGDPAEVAIGKVKYTVLGKNREVLWEMLDKKEIDAAIFTGNEAYYSFNPGGSLSQQAQKRGFRTIHRDDKESVARQFKRTGVYPVMHLVTIKRDLAEMHPEVSRGVLQTLRRARELAPNYETAEEKKQSAEEIRFLGYDPYGYKLVDADRKAIEAMVNYLVADGVLAKKVPVESLFAPGTV
ncbi:MAG: ABC transporter substrate-binding protein [Chloroflexi bacterium]|nr:ABC transporter substrate-binding protein [Chloroflexota bacterium]